MSSALYHLLSTQVCEKVYRYRSQASHSSGSIPGGKANAPGEVRSQVPQEPDRPSLSPLSAGITWAYRITSVGLEFVLPAVAGHFLDRRWDSAPIATLVGAILGFSVGMYHLIQIASTSRR